MFNKLILFFFIFIVSNNSLSQIEDSFHYFQKQKYFYTDNNIEVSLNTNLVQLYKNDTLKVEIKIKNVSSRDIYFFEDYQIHYLGFHKVKEYIYIDYGDEFESDIAYQVTMYEINPDSTVLLEFKYIYQDLIDKSFKGFFRVVFGIGYISDIKQVLDYINDNPKYFFMNLNGSFVISSIALEFLLKRMSASLGVRLWL